MGESQVGVLLITSTSPETIFFVCLCSVSVLLEKSTSGDMRNAKTPVLITALESLYSLFILLLLQTSSMMTRVKKKLMVDHPSYFVALYLLGCAYANC